jgi:hypothetical protein
LPAPLLVGVGPEKLGCADMRSSWKPFFRRVARVCAVSGAVAWSSALSYAQIAFDNAQDPVYSDGWQQGDNGGFGWGAWNFDGTYATPIGQTIDENSPPNDLGRSWTLYNADAPPGPGAGMDNAQAGRAIPSGGLSVGETVTVVVDNPIERQFFRGYTVKFNTGGGNTVYAGVPQARMAVGVFDYFTNGRWTATGTGGNPTLFDMDTHHGLRIDFRLTGTNTFHLKMTPLDNPAIAYSKSGTLDGPAGTQIDWVEFEFFNTDSDWYPSPAGTAGETDFYIRHMLISSLPGDFDDDGDVDVTDYLTLVANLHTDVSGLTPPQSYPLGDMTGDLQLDGRDFLAFAEAYDEANGLAAFQAMLTALPEPGTCGHALMCLAGVTASRRRAREWKRPIAGARR